MARRSAKKPAPEPQSGPSLKVRAAISLAFAAAAITVGTLLWRALPDNNPRHQTPYSGYPYDKDTQAQRQAQLDAIPPAPGTPVPPPPPPTRGTGVPPVALGPTPTPNGPKPLGPIALGAGPADTRVPAPAAIAPAALTVGSHDDADPLAFAFHPSRFADPGRMSKTLGTISLSADPSPPSGAAAPAGPPDHYAEALRLEKARAFAMSLCLDLQGRLWVGSENTTPGDGTGGVQCYDPAKPPLEAWTQYLSDDSANKLLTQNSALRTQNSVHGGLGDDNGYALACDHQGRIWVGHLNHGISVFNGEKWQNYEVVAGLSIPGSLNGPLGERIFHITIAPEFAQLPLLFHDTLTGKDSPMSGSVWMCTSAGLVVYFPSTDTWSYITRAEGMPSDQANSLAFAPDGTVYVATQCDGIAIARPADHYATWKQVARRASDVARERGDSSLITQNSSLSDELPTTATGSGLPTNLMNDILVAKDGTVYAATTAGLAWSTDAGLNWQFVRGSDYADKVRGSTIGAPPGWAPQTAILSEDYSTVLGEDDQGRILVGHRSSARDLLLPQAQSCIGPGSISWLNCYLRSADGRTLFYGGYGSGLGIVQYASAVARPAEKSFSVPAKMPAGQVEADALQLLANRHAAPVSAAAAPLGFIGEDWSTKGDWLGRYGRQYANLCAHGSPMDAIFPGGMIGTKYLVKATIGEHIHDGDGKRNWLTGLKTDDPNSLWNPIVDARREGEWDDHGESYPKTWEGPGLILNIMLPEGRYRLSLYFYDGNGYSHAMSLKGRDYLLLAGEASSQGAPFQPSTRVRVRNFHGGQYKQFLMEGGHSYRIEVQREGSVNTILNGVFIDRLAGPPGRFDGAPLGSMGRVHYDPPKPPAFDELPAHSRAIVALWGDPSVGGFTMAGLKSLQADRVLAYRALAASNAPDALLGAWRWSMPLWMPEDRQQWKEYMNLGWTSFLDVNPQLRQRLLDKEAANK